MAPTKKSALATGMHDPKALDGKDGLAPSAAPHQLDTKAKPAPAKKQGYFIDRMPEVIRKVVARANTGGRIKKSARPDEMMDYWRKNKGKPIADDDYTKAEWGRFVVDVDELRSWSKSTKFKGEALPIWAKTAMDPNTAAGGAVARFILQEAKKQNLAPVGMFIFPVPVPVCPAVINELAANPERNDMDYIKVLKQWEVHWEGDGDLDLDPADPLALYIGRFGWGCFPMGQAEFKPNGDFVIHIGLVGIYGIDKYDFSNDSATWDQPLGKWNVDDGKENIQALNIASAVVGFSSDLISDAGYYPPMGDRYITNKCFERYRYETGFGRDFVIVSNIKFILFKQDWVTKDGGRKWQQVQID